MNKTTKIILGSVAALGLLGGGTALAVANHAKSSTAATSSSESSVQAVQPGTQQGGMGQPPADGGGPGGGEMRGGGPIADALAEALGIDATTVQTAFEEVLAAQGTSARPDFRSTEFIDALAEKLGVASDELSKAMAALPQPGGPGGPGGQPPAEAGATASSSASSEADA